MNAKQLMILELMNKDARATQRSLAAKAGISVGTANATVRFLQANGFITISTKEGQYEYQLTEAGLAALESYIESIQLKKIALSHMNRKPVKQAIILSAGRRREFDLPVGFLTVGGHRILDRQVRLLEKHGIDKIIVIAGYKHEMYRNLQNECHILYNPQYDQTGTMASLALADQAITDDFIVLEGDLYFEDKAISELLAFNKRNCILLSDRSYSGDEMLVEIRDHYVYKLGKELSQFNQIHGEMVGMCKLSVDIYHKMLGEYRHNQNPYVNYEHILMDVAGRYSIGYLKVSDLRWSEVDNAAQYEQAKNIANILSMEENNATKF